MRSSVFLRLSLFAVCAFLLSGCSPSSSSHLASSSKVQISGKLHGGQQPVVGSTIQVYAVGNAGDASSAMPLLTTPVTTGRDGSFSLVTGDACPSSSALVYLVATSGDPGFSNGANNNAIAMMAALGPCGQIEPSTFIYVNELTTVGSIAALYPYASSSTNIGSNPSDAAQLATAFATVNEYTNTTNGTVPGPTLPSGFYASSTEIDTLANILAACVNSAGGTANDGSPCGYLFSLAKPSGLAAPTDTIGAIIDILKYPNPSNVAALYALSPAAAPFQPSLAAAPSDWSLPILAIPAAPTFSLPSGYYPQAQSLTLSEATPGASVYYTLDGSTPTTASYPYTGSSITIAATMTVKAIAVNGGRAISSVASAAYGIAPTLASIAATSGNNQSAPAASAFASPLQVQVLDSISHAVAGITVSFAAPSSGATANLSSSTCVTDNLGLCSVLATAGPVVGGPYTVTASAGAFSTTFSLTNTTESGSHNFVVTVATDASATVAGHCVDQSSGSGASNASCSLRDAIQAASQTASSGAPATIRFAQTVPTTISLAQGTLNLPSYTTVQGATSGSGSSLTNLITIDGGHNATVFTMSQSVQTILNNLVIANGYGSPGGGGVYQTGGSLTINSSTFSGNSTSSCGGALCNNGGTLTVTNCTFTSNSASSYGGAIDNFALGTLVVSNSTFTANQAGTDGGAIYAHGPATITSSTISGNSAPTGGGIYNLDGGSSVSNSIITNNTGGDCGGIFCAANWYYVNFDYAGGHTAPVDSLPITLSFSDSFSNTFSQTMTYGQFSTPASVVSAFSSYFAQNFSGLDTTSITGQSFSNLLVITPLNGATLNPITISNTGQSFAATQITHGFLLANSHNVFGVTPAQASFFGLTSVAANLGSLANNGGPTQTMLPLTGSAAFCAISPSTATGTDQRGQPRAVTVGGTTCQDAGSVQTDQ